LDRPAGIFQGRVSLTAAVRHGSISLLGGNGGGPLHGTVVVGVQRSAPACAVESEYVRKSSFVAESTKLGDLYADLARETYKPFEDQLGKVAAAK
jgi:hypothetical protein